MEGGVLKHRPGQELILSAPKSVSIMALVAKDERLIVTHEKAVEGVISYIERNMIYTRVQQNGVLRIEKTNNIIARYTHLTARPSKCSEDKKVDPQLHSHAVIVNATHCADGQWRSIVFDKLYENKMHIGELYRMELANSIERLGYEVELKKDKFNHWIFEITHVPPQDIQEFSKRRAGIMEAARALGKYDAESLALIAKSTRDDKIQYTIGELEKNWQGRVEDLAHLQNLRSIAIGIEPESSNIELSNAITYYHLR